MPSLRSISAAICPPAPLLARELTGLDPAVPELRQACATAVERLAGSGAEVIAVVGSGAKSVTWPADGRLDVSAFAPALGAARGVTPGGYGGPRLPRSVGLGARLLDEAGYQGTRLLRSVWDDEPAEECLRLGIELGGLGERVGLLVMADGSACRSLRAPGYLHPAAAGFDAALEQAVRDGDLSPLRNLDRSLARELLVTARTSWQVLAGALPGQDLTTDVLYADDPFGVFYLVACLAGSSI